MIHSDAFVNETINFRESRPRRPQFLFFVRHLWTVVGFLVALIVLFSAFPYAPMPSVVMVAGYFFYHYVFLRRLLPRPSPIRNETMRLFMRTAPVFLAVTLFLAWLEWYTPYSADIVPDTLWLLYFLVIFAVCQRGSVWMLIAYCLASAAALLVIRLGIPGTGPGVMSLRAWTAWFVASLWLAALALIYRLVARYIGEMLSDFHLLSAVQEELASRAPFRDERTMLDLAVLRMRENLHHDHFNIFGVDGDGALRCLASAAANGEALKEGFVLEAGTGILGRVVRTGTVHYSNDVRRDEDYVSVPIYTQTESEMGAPIFDVHSTAEAGAGDDAGQGRRLIGVLDVQSNQRNTFLGADVHLMRNLADLIGAAWVNYQLADRANALERRYNDAVRALLAFDLGSQQIVVEVRDALEASLVVLFERDLTTGAVEVTAHDGYLNQPSLFRSSADQDLGLVRRVLDGHEDACFQPRLETTSPEPAGPATIESDPHDRSFVAREQIVSRSIFRLRSEDAVVGVLFVNYRQAKDFPAAEQDRQRRFAEIAALAVAGRQQHLQRIASERASLARLLHDGPLNRASITAELVGAALDDESLDGEVRRKLQIAESASQHLAQDLRFLERTWHGNPTRDLYLALTRAAAEAELAFGLQTTVRMEAEQLIVPAPIVSELSLIVTEAIRNAHQHGEAQRVEISVSVSERNLSLVVADNGRGFVMGSVNGHGIHNMKHRAEYCGGTFEIHSSEDQGTRVQVLVPVAA